MAPLETVIMALAKELGFSTSDGKIFVKKYPKHSDYELSINVPEERFEYGPKITLGDKTTANFAHSENVVVFECVNRLLEKGYKPEGLTLEKKWALGRTQKSGKADIIVADLTGKTLFIIECKNWADYDKEKRLMQGSGGQLFSYLQQDRNTQYLCLYTSTLANEGLRYENAIVRAVDDEQLIEQKDKNPDEDILLFRDASTVQELHSAWRESYACYFHPNGIFDDDAEAYRIQLKPLKLRDLKRISEGDGAFIHNQFAEILRHNNISDRENAFNKMISLFLCKVVDENKGENDIVDFQWKERSDSYEDLQDRLQLLHKTGMRDYLREEVIYFENDYVEKAFQYHKKAVAKDKMLAMLKALKFYTNNEFAFKEVHNKRLFEQNAKVVNEAVQLIQPFRIKYSQKQQFLGNLFELLLNDGLKQSEGQFFTPIPIAGFIIACLPLKEMMSQRQSKAEVRKFPKIVDFACGPGHFLTEAIDAIQRAAVELGLPESGNTGWTRDYIYGIERDYRLARVAKIACFMNGAGDANIIHGSGLEVHDELDGEGTFDGLAANPPYSIKDFKQHLNLKRNEFSLLGALKDSSSEIEALFVERALQLLKPGGIAGIILPSSILSNVGIYTRVRELLLRNFRICGIVELGGSTFIATGTNTVIVFLQKNSDGKFTHFTYRAEAIFDEGKLSDSEFQDGHLLRDYVEALGLEFADYETLIRRKPNQAVFDSEFFLDYRRAWLQLPEARKLGKTLTYIALKDEEKKELVYDRMLKFIILREKEKFIHYCLAYDQQVVVVKPGSDKETEKQFLGYEWSKRRGAEGMHRIGAGLLYDPVDPYNMSKAAGYIRCNFLGEAPEAIDSALTKHVSVERLAEMIEFEEAGFDLRIAIDPKVELPQSTKYPSVRFEALATLEYGKALPAKRRTPGPYAVMGSNGVDGNHNHYLIEGPAIVVGRKGSAGKVSFSQENCYPIDTTFWVKFDPKRLHPRFLYWLLLWLDLTQLVGRRGIGVPGLNRRDVHRSLIPDVPVKDQEQILKEIASIDEQRKDAFDQSIAVLERHLVRKAPTAESVKSSSP